MTDWQITFWDVGQGDATDILLPDGTRILIDFGPSLRNRNPLPSWFLRKGSPPIRLAVLTHSHEDHFGGLAELCREPCQRIDRIAVMNDRALRGRSGSPSFQSLFRALADRKRGGDTKLEILDSEGDLYLDDDFRLRLVYPKDLTTEQRLPDLNLTSMVIVLEPTSGDTGQPLVVWGGDNSLSNIGDALPRSYPYILMGPHHGHPPGRPKTPEYVKFFKNVVTPKYVYVSVGRCNMYSLPDPYYIKGASCSGVRICCSQLSVNCDPSRERDVYEGSAMIGLDKPVGSVQCRGAMRVFANPISGIRFGDDQSEFEDAVRSLFPSAPCNRLSPGD